MEKIDFVITWVDGNDPKWLAEKRRYEGKEEMGGGDANAECRYRADDDLLKYWFRSVEKYAPWVNKIYFVTCGQKPEWLAESHARIVLVNHTDYIPEKYLPTFNANTIEINVHRIEGLSEHFVFFNDDTYLLQPVGKEFFFRNGNPVIATDLRYTPTVTYSNWSRFVFNDYCLVKNSFDTRRSIWENRNKWFSVSKLGLKRVRQNFLCYLANKTIPVGTYGHVAFPYLKSTVEEVWTRWPDVMETTSMHKFRSDDQVNQWLFCAWNQAKGRFYPVHESCLGRNVDLSPENVDWICEVIRNQSEPQICMNDTAHNTDPERCGELVRNALEEMLPEKSSFEK